MFRRLFGESKSKSVPRGEDNQHRDALKTIDHLQQSQYIMEKKLEKFDEEINEIQNKARQCLTKANPDKNGAIRFIKRRKELEQQRDKLWQMKENVELVNSQVQTSHFNRQITDSLNIGQQHLKRAQKSMPTKKIEEIIDNITEQIDLSNDINDLLSTPIPNNDLTTTDYDLEKELNTLNNEIVKENMIQINLPSAHSGSIKISSTNRELERLTQG